MKALYRAVVIATGVFKGYHITVRCRVSVETSKIKIAVKGLQDTKKFIKYLHNYMIKRCTELSKIDYCYKPRKNTIEAYWTALNEIFDETPCIIVKGDVNAVGSPYNINDVTTAIF